MQRAVRKSPKGRLTADSIGERGTQDESSFHNFAAFFLFCIIDTLKINLGISLRQKYKADKMLENFTFTINQDKSENNRQSAFLG